MSYAVIETVSTNFIILTSSCTWVTFIVLDSFILDIILKTCDLYLLFCLKQTFPFRNH